MYTLRQATKADAAFLARLHHATMQPYLEQTLGWDEATQLAMFGEQFDPTHLQIILLSGREVGALRMEWQEETLALANLQLLPEEQGKGLGTLILTHLLDLARFEGVPATLYVLKVNPSRRLFERLGFRVLEETPTSYLMQAEPEA
jgi:GNAT superfamily N-acetyltransferase